MLPGFLISAQAELVNFTYAGIKGIEVQHKKKI